MFNRLASNSNRKAAFFPRRLTTILTFAFAFPTLLMGCIGQGIGGGDASEDCGKKKLLVQSSARPPISLSQTDTYDAFGIILKVAEGPLLAVYRQGKTHAEDNGGIVMRKSDDGKVWSAPRVLFDDPYFDDRDVAGGVLPSGTIVIFWDQLDFRPPRKHARVLFSRSLDGGESWSPPVSVTDRDNTYGSLIILPGRAAICLSRFVQDWTWEVYIHFSSDDGATWNETRRIWIPGKHEHLPTQELSFVPLGEDRLLGFVRNRPGKPFLRLYTHDGGKTWDIAQTGFKPSEPAPTEWEFASPWVLQPYPSLTQIDLWFAERILVRSHEGVLQRGRIRSAVFDSEQAVSSPQCLHETRTLYEGRFTDFGYPSVATYPDGRFIATFYSRTETSPPDVYLLFGEYSTKGTTNIKN